MKFRFTRVVHHHRECRTSNPTSWTSVESARLSFVARTMFELRVKPAVTLTPLRFHVQIVTPTAARAITTDSAERTSPTDAAGEGTELTTSTRTGSGSAAAMFTESPYDQRRATADVVRPAAPETGWCRRHTLARMTDETVDLSQPPSADDAAQLFMALSQEFLELVPRLKTHTTSYTAAADHPVSHFRTTRRVVVLTLSLGRKFMKKGEATYLPGLLTRIYKERKERIPRAWRRAVRVFTQDVRIGLEGLHSNGMTISHMDGTTTSAEQLWEYLSYGYVLHPDYEKWAAGTGHAWEAGAFNAYFSVARLRRLIVDTRSLIELLDKEGVFDGLTYEENLWIDEDIWAADGTPVEPGPGSPKGV